MGEMLDGFQWHSSIGLDAEIVGRKAKVIRRLPNIKKARSLFIVAGESLLIHKATNALWRVTKDKKAIEPVFDTDVLTEEEIKKTK